MANAFTHKPIRSLSGLLVDNVDEFIQDPLEVTSQRLAEAFPMLSMTQEELMSKGSAVPILESTGFGGILGNANDAAIAAYKKLPKKMSANDKWKKTGVIEYGDGYKTHYISEVTNPNELKLLDLDAETIGEAIDYPSFFERYPEAKKIKYKKGIEKNNFNRDTNTMTHDYEIMDDPRSVMEHELSHYVQTQEGLPIGGNIESMRYIRQNPSSANLLDIPREVSYGFPLNLDVDQNPYRLYRQLGGEDLAYSAGSRVNASAKYRAEHMPHLNDDPLLWYHK